LTRYIGENGIAPVLSSLQKGEWTKLKTKAQKSITTAAKELLDLYARRELSKAKEIGEIDTKGYLEFVDHFQYSETKISYNRYKRYYSICKGAADESSFDR
jgi:transcription-repair coupling factor (superfamily II helicase)